MQDLTLTEHHARYAAIDPETTLKGSADGKVIFISGGSQGIGRATAVAFAQAGARAVYVTARSARPLAETEAVVRQANPATACASKVCDVTDSAQVEAAIADCVTRFGGIDAVDTNAGYLDRWAKIGESDPESWWRTWEVNLKGTYLVLRHAMRYLIAARGHAILTSSIGAQLLMPTASDYQTSKHAVNRLCEFVDVDHGADGVKCFAIHPGGVATELGKHMPAGAHKYLVDPPELAAGFKVWLCSGRADWAHGRYLSANWDIDELARLQDTIVRDDLLVNRLRTGREASRG